MVKGTILLTKESRRVEKLRLKDVKYHPHTLKVLVFRVRLTYTIFILAAKALGPY